MTTHPIQYYSPVFRLLSERGRIDVCVFFTWEREASRHDRDFGRSFEWDIPLLDGYEHVFVSNGGSLRKDFLGVRNRGLEDIVEGWAPDAVLFYGWNHLSHLRAMRHFHGRIPVLFWGDSNLVDPMPSWKKALRRLFLRWVYSHVDAAFSVGTNSRAYFEAMGMAEDSIRFAPHAIDNGRFAAASEKAAPEASRLRESMGIGRDETVFLFAGKFIEKKDPLLLLEAFLGLGTEHAHLVFIGDGVLKGRLLEMSRGQAGIHVLPFQNQSGMPLAYALCDVFCLPSRGPGETWGLAVNEAMACGRAVLVSDRVGCAVDLVADCENGYVFRNGDKDDLIGKMRLLLDVGSARRMGLKSRERVQPWNFTSVAEAFESTLAGVSGGFDA